MSNQKITKAVIPAAGKGTRLEPLTLAIPKEMIRVGRKPVIHHVIDVLKAGGLSEILIITGWKKGAIHDYIGSGQRLGVDAYYKIQDEQLGLGHAVLLAKSWVKNEDFVVIYGDNYIKPDSIMEQIIDLHQRKKSYATIVVHPVDDPSRFGLVKADKDGKILGMIEKPSKEEAEKYKTGNEFLSISGIVVLSPKIFEYIEKTKPGKKNEVQLTDALELMRQANLPMYVYVFKGKRFDIGTWESLEEVDKLNLTE